MTERLLQFLWQFQYFNARGLETSEGEQVQIIYPGQFNSNQGPDFTHAKIKIGNTEWAGMVELHILSSDWKKHQHQFDTNYDNVILHVVWSDDGGPAHIPVVELNTRVSKFLLQRYEELMHSSAFIACEKSIHLMPSLNWDSWKERLVAERLIRKSILIETDLQQNNFHWEETFWRLLAKNFGSTVNAEAFEMMARSIPIKLLAKLKNQIHQLEALLLGQVGLLENNFIEAYPAMEKREYIFLRKTYKLHRISLPIHFLRMRPGNFPTIRLAQLAMLIHASSHLFSKFRESPNLKEVRSALNVTANDYWHYHYRFDEYSSYKPKKLGHAMIDSIIINTIAPMLFAYGRYHRDTHYQDKSIQWLEETNPEINLICKGFEKIGINAQKAYDSQALLELKNQYCNQKKCLDCAVGNFLLSRLSKV